MAASLGALDGAEEREGRGLLRDGVVLGLLASLVLRLEGLEELLEVRVRLLDLPLRRGNLGVEVGVGESLLLLDDRLLVVGAQVDVLGAAGGAEVILGPLGEGVVVAAALVGVARRRGGAGEVLDGGVSLDAVLLQILLGAPRQR